MLNNIKKLALPDSALNAIRDAIVDRLAEHLDGKKRRWILNFHSDGKFKIELNAALERAVYHFTEEHEDQEFVDAVARNTEFWSLKSVQDAVKEIAVRPSYLEEGFRILRQTFAQIAPAIELARVDDAVRAFLRCVSEEIMNIPQLAPIYQVQLQKISVQQGREMITVLMDANEMQRKGLLALLEIAAQQSKLLLDRPASLDQINGDDLQELKTRYFESIKQKYEYMDMGGISPRVTSKAESRIVSIRMEDVFIPLKAVSENLHGYFFPKGKKPKLIGVLRVYEEPDLKMEVAKEELVETQRAFPVHLDLVKNELAGMAKIFEKRKAVVLGHPGAGKTTIGKYVVYTIATQGNMDLIGEHLRGYIPVVVKAAEYAKFLHKDDSISFYRYVTGKLYTDDYGSLFAWALKHRLCFIIIDGLDEVPDAALRVQVASKIEQFVSDYWENRFLVTSRLVGYRGNQLTGDFAHFTLAELEKDQIIGFLTNWYIAVAGKKTRTIERESNERAKELWRAIETNEGVKKLSGTPLLLTIIALVNYYGSKLPERRVELYQLATETLLSNWPLKQRGQKIDWKEVLAILEPIAFHIFTTSEDRLITEYEFRPLFEQQVCKLRGTSASKTRTISSQLLDKIELHTGFFLKRGTNEKGQEVYGFLHPTFAEYLTARYLAQRWVEEHKLGFTGSVHEPAWHEVVLLMAGHLGTMMDILATRLVGEIEKLDSLYDEYLHRDLLLVGEIIGDNVPVSREKREEIVSKLISLALETSYRPLWDRIVELLEEIAKAFPFISQPEQLRIQEEEEVAQRVRKVLLLRSIGIYKQQLGIDTLVEGLSIDDWISDLARSRLTTLGSRIRRNDVTHLLIVIEPYLRLIRLPKIVSEQIIKIQSPLLNIHNFFEDFEKEVNSSTIWLVDIQQIAQLDALKIASLLLYKGQNFWEKKYILTEILDLKKLLPSIFDQWVKLATSSQITEEDRLVALNALEVISDYGYAIRGSQLGASPRLSEWESRLQSIIIPSNKPKLRSKALKVLLDLPLNQRYRTEILLRGFSDPDSEVRAMAAMGARVKSSKLIQQRLRELLEDSSPDVRRASALNLVWTESINEKEIATLLEAIFGESANSSIDYDIMILLKLADVASTLETFNIISNQLFRMVERTRDDEEKEYQVLPHTLWGNGAKSHGLNVLSKPIISLFGSNKVKIRRRAVIIWAFLRNQLPGRIPLPLLEVTQILPLLKDDEVSVKVTAIHILQPRDLSVPEVINVLSDALRNNDSKLQIAAMKALRGGNISRPEIVDELLKALKGESLEVVSEAALTLANIKDTEMRKNIVTEAGRLITDPLKGKYAYDILWKLLVTTNMVNEQFTHLL